MSPIKKKKSPIAHESSFCSYFKCNLIAHIAVVQYAVLEVGVLHLNWANPFSWDHLALKSQAIDRPITTFFCSMEGTDGCTDIKALTNAHYIRRNPLKMVIEFKVFTISTIKILWKQLLTWFDGTPLPTNNHTIKASKSVQMLIQTTFHWNLF